VASPFAVFRRNQRVLLAVVAISAMIAFVFLDPVMKYVGGSARRIDNPIVVETKFGPLTYGQLESMRASRELVDRFLRAVTQETVIAQLNKGLIDPRLQNQAGTQLYSFWHQTLMGRSKPGPQESAVETLVLSKQAERLGMVVSDRAINDLIKQITDDSLSSESLQAVIAHLQGGRHRVSVARLFDSIRTEMLASKLSQLFFQSLRDVPPAERFELYESLNRHAKAEVLPLAVSSFVSQVSAEPTAEQLRAFYDEHKNSYPDPASPEPGFKEPKRASFQYFKADFAKFQEEFKPQVTEAEISAYYEKNKAQFRAVELPPEQGNSEDQADATKEEPKDEASTEESAQEAPAKESPKNEEPAKDDAKPTETDKPAAEKPADGPAPQAGLRRGAMRLVSATTSTDAPDDKPAATGAAEKTCDPPASEKPAETPSDTEKKPADETETKPDASTDAAPADAAPSDAAAKPAEEIKYEPLEKVKDQIRDSIAGEKARERIGAIFDELQAAMRRYADDRDLAATHKTEAAMVPFPLDELAKSKNVEGKSLELVSPDEAASADLGQVQRTVRRSQFDFRNVPFADFAFSDSFVTYKPETGADAEGNQYLFWKTEERPTYVPALDKIRDKVILAWKTIKARELARKRAEELAAQARAAKKPLSELFAGQGDLKPSETNSFSWLTSGNVPFDPSGSEPRISQVEGVEYPSEDFMKAVFALSPGEIGVAMNAPRNAAYVVRLVEYDRSTEELRNDFATEPPMRYMAAADQQRRDVYRAWLEDLNRDADVRWLRPPDVVSSRVSSGGPVDDGDF
jgi:hypothetical protein